MMDEQFIRNRLTKLRQQKQVSERKTEPGFRSQYQLYPQYHVRQGAPIYERISLYL